MNQWKLVPVEPTPEMINAWNNDDSDEFRHAYHVMLEASPQPPKLSNERLRHYAAKIRKALEPDPVGATLIIVALLRAIEREILGGGHE